MIKKKTTKGKGKVSITTTGSVQPIITEVTSTCTPANIQNKIDVLEIDLGRGDLNILRDKINEIIKHVS